MAVRIWTLNRATSLVGDRGGESAKGIARIFSGGLFSSGVGCEWGQRDGSINMDGFDDGHRLMHQGSKAMDETDPRNEYWVPIALKCIGRWYDPSKIPQDVAGSMDGALLNRIVAQYDYWQNQQRFEDFWARDAPHGVRMNTRDFKGYYEILSAHTDNVLIGYSQGGLVARYLAFLDEHVFKRNVIKAVITISSPNHGSPLADPVNREQITDGALKVILSLVSLHAEVGSKPLRSVHRYLAGKIEFAQLYGVIDELYEELGALPNPSGREESIHDSLGTALKWLSGLDGAASNRVRYSAFDDLGVTSYLQQHSVLSLVNEHSLKKIYYGAIIGSNNSLDDLISGVGGLKYKVARIFMRSLRRNVQAASTAYADNIMRETLATPDSVYGQDVLMKKPTLTAMAQNVPFQTGVQRYREGWQLPQPGNDLGPTLPAATHDFVIPSHSQGLPAGSLLLGNLVNDKANHNSGKDRSKGPGKVNYRHIKQLLKRLNTHLTS